MVAGVVVPTVVKGSREAPEAVPAVLVLEDETASEPDPLTAVDVVV